MVVVVMPVLCHKLSPLSCGPNTSSVTVCCHRSAYSACRVARGVCNGPSNAVQIRSGDMSWLVDLPSQGLHYDGCLVAGPLMSCP